MMILPESLIENMRFLIRHDYANPNARLFITRKEGQSILNNLMDYKTLLTSMRIRDPELDPVFMEQHAEHKLENLQFVPPVIPRYLTGEEYHKNKLEDSRTRFKMMKKNRRSR